MRRLWESNGIRKIESVNLQEGNSCMGAVYIQKPGDVHANKTYYYYYYYE